MFNYGKVSIGGEKPVIIAEAGVNHLKDLDLAKRHIIAAKKAGADIIVTGTLVETSNKLKEEMSQLIEIIHSG